MLFALAVATILLVVLLLVLTLPRLHRVGKRRLGGGLSHMSRWASEGPPDAHDPGRELRAEQRARALLRSCVNEQEWAMYSELGFLRVWGTTGERHHAYLIYPHAPIIAYLPQTGTVLGEYCIEFPDHTRPYGSSRLPDADDVLAKWIALNTDEQALLEQANMHLPGRQIALARTRRDLTRLSYWERARQPRLVNAGSVPAQ